MKARAVWNDAFLVCHEIYAAARELVDSRVPTTQLTSASKFLWRPDLRPRLVEYVADFARCGERALGESIRNKGRADFRLTETHACCHPESAQGGRGNCFPGPCHEKADSSGKPRPRNDTFAYFSASCHRAKRGPRASRLILFRMYYLGGAEYEAARHLLGLSERTWSDWAEEVRQRVGAELIRARMYPPARYFREASTACGTTAASAASTNQGAEALAQEDCRRDAR
jgi:hypothetical protein